MLTALPLGSTGWGRRFTRIRPRPPTARRRAGRRTWRFPSPPRGHDPRPRPRSTGLSSDRLLPSCDHQSIAGQATSRPRLLSCSAVATRWPTSQDGCKPLGSSSQVGVGRRGGKTSVSLAVAHAVRDRYPDGVWFVELAPVSEADSVAVVVAGAFNHQAQSGVTVSESVGRLLARKEALLVLDNCEHVLDGVSAFVELLSGRRVHSTSCSRAAKALGSRRSSRSPWHPFRLMGRRPRPSSCSWHARRRSSTRSRSTRRTFTTSSRSATSSTVFPSPSSSPPRECAPSPQRRSASDSPTGYASSAEAAGAPSVIRRCAARSSGRISCRHPPRACCSTV